MKTQQEILSTLPQFTGTESYSRFGPSLLTDGVAWLINATECFWLIDIINSVQILVKVRAEYFQTFELQVKNNKAKVIVTDGNNNILYKQSISYTDFPLDNITLWRVDGVIILKSEY